MFHVFSVLRRLWGLAVLVFAPFVAAAAEPPPLSAYGNLPDIERMALSNDGSRLAAVMTIGGERVVVLMTAELDTLRMTKIEEAKVRGLEWVGSDHVVVELSHTETLGPEYSQSQFEFFHALILPTDPVEEQQMVFDDATMLNAVFGWYGVRRIDGRWKVYLSGVERERGARGYYTVVPFDQSDNMAHALAAAGKPYKLVVMHGEDHWLSRPATRLQMLEETVAFVEQNNPPD
jgi:hypothetical protein